MSLSRTIGRFLLRRENDREPLGCCIIGEEHRRAVAMDRGKFGGSEIRDS